MAQTVKSTKRVPLSKLKPYERNPRRGDVAAIKASLERHGQYRALVVNADGTVLAGNHTLAALREMGAKDALVHYVDVDETEAARIVLVDNRTNDLAGYDDGELLALMQSLPDLEGTGWSETELVQFEARVNPPDGADTEAGEPPATPRTKPGDLWVLGEHRLLCGSSAESDDVLRLMAGDLAQMVMADPPYNVNYRGGTNGPKGQLKRERADAYDDEFDDYEGWLTAVLTNAAAASDEKAALHLWYATSQERAVLGALDAAKWVDRSMIVWDKGSIQGGIGQTAKQYRTRFEPMWYCHKKGKTPRWCGPGNESDVWEESGPRNNPLHPTMKPIPLYERSLTNHTIAGDIVLECFGGSGTTMIAAENLKRRARLMEIDPGYCDVIVDRWERHTGGTAQLEE